MKCYLGDGVYVETNELGLVLTTENPTNRIVLEPAVYHALEQYVEAVRDKEEEET